MNQGSDAIEFRNASVTFQSSEGKSIGVSDVTAPVPAGKVVTLVGPSGSGKSTLLSLCNLLRTPDSGEVRVFDKEVREWNVNQLRRTVAMVFQSPTMFAGTVRDNIELGLRLRGQSLHDAVSWLHKVGLGEEVLTREAKDLSGGQKQRVSLLRALVTEPEVLLLDEVTSALDPDAGRQVEQLIREYQENRGCTVLWVTHQLDQARRVGDLAWLMVGGRLVEQAPTEEFFSRPKEAATRAFLDSGARRSGEIGGEDA